MSDADQFFLTLIIYIKIFRVHHLDISKNKTKKGFKKRSWSFWRRKKRRPYGHEQYKNLPEDEKQRLIEYRKK